MAFSAADVKNLREMTGVGMMDCKKALTAADGDIDKAVEWLREKGLAAAQKKAGRIAAEGMAYAAVVDGIGVIVEVNAESDFVAKNDLFVDSLRASPPSSPRRTRPISTRCTPALMATARPCSRSRTIRSSSSARTSRSAASRATTPA